MFLRKEIHIYDSHVQSHRSFPLLHSPFRDSPKDFLDDAEALGNNSLGLLDTLVLWLGLGTNLETEVDDLLNDVQSFLCLSFVVPELLLITVVWDHVEDILEDVETFTDILISNGESFVLRFAHAGNVDACLSKLADAVDGSHGRNLPLQVLLAWLVGKSIDDVVKSIEATESLVVESVLQFAGEGKSPFCLLLTGERDWSSHSIVLLLILGV